MGLSGSTRAGGRSKAQLLGYSLIPESRREMGSFGTSFRSLSRQPASLFHTVRVTINV